MAPEVMEGNGSFGADVFAWAVTVINILTQQGIRAASQLVSHHLSLVGLVALPTCAACI